MGREELLEAQHAQVAFSEIVAVQRVDLWIRVHVADALDIDRKELMVGCFVCEMGERLRRVALIVADRSKVVVVFAVLPRDV